MVWEVDESALNCHRYSLEELCVCVCVSLFYVRAEHVI